MKDLPWILLGLRIMSRTDGSVSPAEMTYGTTLSLPRDIAQRETTPDIKTFTRDLKERITKYKSPEAAHHRLENPPLPKEISLAPFVFVRQDQSIDPLAQKYTGPFRVLEQRGNVFKLEFGDRTDWVSVSRLKPAR